MQPRHDGHIEDGRFGVTRVSCRCQVCYKGFMRTGAEALIPLNSIANYKINKILGIIEKGEIDNYYPANFQEWCFLKLHVCDDCWQKSMSRKIKKQQTLLKESHNPENDPMEEAKDENIESDDDIEEIYNRYEEIKRMIHKR